MNGASDVRRVLAVECHFNFPDRSMSNCERKASRKPSL